jgi:hypothetical protein
MYKTHRGLYPPDDNTIIWRYLDFTKFVDLLNCECLYFARADKFEDPFEGLYPVMEEIKRDFKTFDIIRKQNYINCWAIGDHESAALWKIYSDSKNSIAIQTTFANLKSSIEKSDDDVYASVVRYKDYSKTDLFGIIDENIWAPEHGGATVFPIIYKRMSFSFENELRLIHIKGPVTLELNENLTPIGQRVKVDLDKMIGKIHLSPYSEKWFQELVLGLLDKYLLGHKEILRSDLFSGLK